MRPAPRTALTGSVRMEDSSGIFLRFRFLETFQKNCIVTLDSTKLELTQYHSEFLEGASEIIGLAGHAILVF